MPSLNVASKLIHLLDRVGLEKVLVVEMVEQDVEALLGVGNMLLVLRRSLRLHALHVGIEDLVDGTRCVGNVRPIAGGCTHVRKML